MTLNKHLERYLDFQQRANEIFSSVRADYPELVRCASGCDECCSVYFDLSLIEAFFISGMLMSQTPDLRSKIVQKATELADEFTHAREVISSAIPEGKIVPAAIEDGAAKIRIECPLRDGGSCLMYEYRPVTCRLYGIPQRLGDRVVCCPRADSIPVSSMLP